MKKDIELLFESGNSIVRDKYGICWYKIPKYVTLTPCAKFCNFWDNKRGCVCTEIVEMPGLSYSKDFMHYCYDLSKIASIYGLYVVPIDIPEEFYKEAMKAL